MGQKEVLDILKRNPAKFFTVVEISKIAGSNVQTVYSLLKKLVNNDEIEFKQFLPKQGPPAKLYAYTKKNNHFEQTVSEYIKLKAENRFSFMPSDVLTNLMVVKEIKEMKEMLNNVGKN